MLLSLLRRKRPRMLTAITFSPLSDSMLMIVCTDSYKIEFPTFLVLSVFVATYCSRLDKGFSNCNWVNLLVLKYRSSGHWPPHLLFPKYVKTSIYKMSQRKSPFLFPRVNVDTFTWRKGSVIPETSCSGAYPESTKFLSKRTSAGTNCCYRLQISHMDTTTIYIPCGNNRY